MQTSPFYVIKPTLHENLKVTYGDRMDLTPQQAEHLLLGGFIGTHQPSAVRIGELVAERDRLIQELEQAQAQESRHLDEEETPQPS